MYIHPHSVAYDLESFETFHRLLVISVRIGKGDHTPVYLQPVQYPYFSVLPPSRERTRYRSLDSVEFPLELFVRMSQSILYRSCFDISIPNDYQIGSTYSN